MLIYPKFGTADGVAAVTYVAVWRKLQLDVIDAIYMFSVNRSYNLDQVVVESPVYYPKSGTTFGFPNTEWSTFSPLASFPTPSN